MRRTRILAGLPASIAIAGLLSSSVLAGDPAADGAQLFATSCGWCHAEGGRVAGKGPKLAGTSRTDEFMIHRIKAGKEGQMPGFGKVFSDEQIAGIVAYIRSLKDE